MATIRKAGKDKVKLVGTQYEQTIKVDEQAIQFLEKNASQIAYNSERNRWDVYSPKGHTTLQRALYTNAKKKAPVGNVVFADYDNTNYRIANLVA